MPLNSLITSVASGPAGTHSFRQLERQIVNPGEGRTLGVDRPQEETEFFGLVQDFLSDVNRLQTQSGNALQAFIAGEITDLHQVMVAGQEAAIALDLMIEIRNRVMESFQEIMRLQI